MPLTLDQYADYLDTRDLTWPAPPAIDPPRALPKVKPLSGLRAVSWNLYGTLLHVSGGALYFQHPQKFVMEVALEKTVQEFKMWSSMTRKPGQPSEYMAQLYEKELTALKMAPSPGEKHPEILAEKVWENLLKKLMQKEYKYEVGFFGSLGEYCRKIAYFFHASLQGSDCYPGAADALKHIHSCGLVQGLVSDAQCFTMTQLRRGLDRQGNATSLDELFPGSMRALSCDQRCRKPSERLFRPFLEVMAKQGIAPHEVLHIGSRMVQDIAPAKRLGMKTALFAGDKESLQGTPEQLRAPATKPNILLTELSQLRDVVTPVS